MLAKSKISLIHIYKSRLGLSEDEYRAMLAGMGKKSSKELNDTQFNVLIKRLKSLVKRDKNSVSDAQIRLITRMARGEYGNKKLPLPPVRSLIKFCRHIAGREIKVLEDMSSSEVVEIIEALKRYYREA